VWQAFGVTDYFGFDFAAGHQHCQAASSQTTNVNAFVNRFLKDQQNVNTKIEANKPNKSNFNLDTTVSWSVPTLTGTYGKGSTTPPTDPSAFTLATAVSPANSGTITKSPVTPSSGKYDSATVVKLTAVAATGYVFDGWDGDVTGKKDTVTISVTMNANKSVTAKFKTPTGISGGAAAANAVCKMKVRTLSNNALSVNFTAAGSGEAELKLYGLNGGLLASSRIPTVVGKSYSHTFNPGKLTNGFYVVGLYSAGRLIEQARVTAHR